MHLHDVRYDDRYLCSNEPQVDFTYLDKILLFDMCKLDKSQG